jgi:hypothetical protein
MNKTFQAFSSRVLAARALTYTIRCARFVPGNQAL